MLHLFFIYNIIKSIQGKQKSKTIFNALKEDFIVFKKRQKMKETMITITIGNMKIKIENTGFAPKESSMYTPAHSHANFEFHMVFKGSSVMDIEEQKISVNQNEFVLVFPETFHCTSSQSPDAQILCFGFSVEKLSKIQSSDFYEKLISHTSQKNEFILHGQNTLVADYLKKIHSHQSLKTAFSSDATKALFVLLFTELFLPVFEKNNSNDNEPQESSNSYLQTVMIENYFNDRYMENITLSKLSSLLYLSEKQTNRLIKKIFGMDFRECLSKIRMKSAKKLLRETKKDVKDIAEAVGYESYNGFYLAFKSKFNMTPLEYRKKHITNMQ